MKEFFAILKIAVGQWRWMAAGILLGVITIAANSLLMALSGWFIASMALSGVTGVSFNYIIPAAAIRALAIVRTVGRYAERLVTHEAAFRVLADLRVWLFRRLEPLAPAHLERYPGGDVAGRLRSDVDALESLYLRIAAPLAVGSGAMVAAVVFVSSWSGVIACWLAGFLLLAGVLLPLWARQLAATPGERATVTAGELRTVVTEGMLGGEELLLLGAADLQAERVDELSVELVAAQERLGGVGALTLAGGITCSGCAVAVLLLAGNPALAAGEITGPVLVMLLFFATAVFEAVVPLSTALQLMPAARAAVGRIGELSEASPPVPEPVRPALLPTATDLVFRNVICSYGDGVPVLNGFNLVVPQGSCVALTGPSGCGKSTLMEILLRFRPYCGSVTVGGKEICDLAGDDLRRLIAVLPQRPHLFNASVRENIMLGKRHATPEELAGVLEDTALSPWLGTLPRGVDTEVGEGGSAVSGGEARRIALARALLKDVPLLLLDEPTEGLDASTERDVVARLAGRIAGRTVLLVTHRPACLSLADRVVRFDDCLGG